MILKKITFTSNIVLAADKDYEKQIAINRQVAVDAQVTVNAQVAVDAQVAVNAQVAVDAHVAVDAQVAVGAQIAVDENLYRYVYDLESNDAEENDTPNQAKHLDQTEMRLNEYPPMVDSTDENVSDDDDVMIIDDDSDDDNSKPMSISDLTIAQGIKSRRESENARIQAQLDKLEKLDISDEEKARQAKQLRMLAFVNPGKFMDDFDPETSAREMKKMNRRLNKEKNTKKNQLYDDRGLLVCNGNDFCDCLDIECPGCHFPCPKCMSEKCGGDCRCNRKWVYDYVESEGSGVTYSWPADQRP